MVTTNELGFFMPEIILAIGAVVVMLVIAFKRNAMVSNVLTVLTFGLAFYALMVQSSQDSFVTSLFYVDGIGRFLTGLILISAIVITLFSFPYFKIH